jgi:2'-5' RNA ligase
VTSTARLGVDERLRLFCAFTLPAAVRAELAAWLCELPRGTARLVAEESLHVTLAFLGPRPVGDVLSIAGAIRASLSIIDQPPVFRPVRYRETRSVGMLILEDEHQRAGRVAADLHGRLEGLGVYRREARPWLPHVTVLRFRRPPRLQTAPPDLASFSPSGAAVYHSLPRRGGARYEVLDSVSLADVGG